MLRGEALLTGLSKETSRSVEEVNINGAWVKRLLLRNGAKAYRTGIDAYLAGKLVERARPALELGLEAVRGRLRPGGRAVSDREWVDACGLLAAGERFERLLTDLERGEVADLEVLDRRVGECHSAYAEDEWAWIDSVWKERFGTRPCEMSGEQLAEAGEMLAKNRGKFIRMVLSDAEKEFSESSRIGFGVGGDRAARDADFEAVRGTFDANKFVKEMKAELAAVEKLCAEFKARAAGLA
jgi:hypothetical protein